MCVFFREFGMDWGIEEGVLFLRSTKKGEKIFWNTDVYFLLVICIISRKIEWRKKKVLLILVLVTTLKHTK